MCIRVWWSKISVVPVTTPFWSRQPVIRVETSAMVTIDGYQASHLHRRQPFVTLGPEVERVHMLGAPLNGALERGATTDQRPAVG